jgi:HEAT repeat protein
MAHTKSGLEVDVLTELIGDAVWFVRLRAAVSLGQLSSRSAVPALVLGLKDANRLVRLRAAEGLVEISGEMAWIFNQVVATQDRYGLHAYLASLENANLRDRLEHDLRSSTTIAETDKTRLQKILELGTLAAEDGDLLEQKRDTAIVRS